MTDPRPEHDAQVPPPGATIAAALAGQPASLWVATLASLGIILGSVAPWATTFTFASVSGTSMHGWREVIVGVVGLAMLVLHQLSGKRLPVIVASIAGALGAIGAIATVVEIYQGGAMTVFGQQYQYVEPAWGLYLVLAATVALTWSASALAWRASRGA